MNIFALDRDPALAATYHCNKHVCKMILESGTMLSTAHWVMQLSAMGKSPTDFRRVRDMQEWLFANVPKNLQPPWKISHLNHPCSIWTRANLENYRWHSDLGLHLCAEYTRRYGARHRSQSVHEWLAKNVPNLPAGKLQEWPQCMPPDCYRDNSIDAYREYYNRHKRRFAIWEPRASTPGWYANFENHIGAK